MANFCCRHSESKKKTLKKVCMSVFSVGFYSSSQKVYILTSNMKADKTC